VRLLQAQPPAFGVVNRRGVDASISQHFARVWRDKDLVSFRRFNQIA
jgi:hypothetical protein